MVSPDELKQAAVSFSDRDELWRLRVVQAVVPNAQEAKGAQGAFSLHVTVQIEPKQFLHAPSSLPRSETEHSGAQDDSQHEVKVKHVEQ